MREKNEKQGVARMKSFQFSSNETIQKLEIPCTLKCQQINIHKFIIPGTVALVLLRLKLIHLEAALESVLID